VPLPSKYGGFASSVFRFFQDLESVYEIVIASSWSDWPYDYLLGGKCFLESPFEDVGPLPGLRRNDAQESIHDGPQLRFLGMRLHSRVLLFPGRSIRNSKPRNLGLLQALLLHRLSPKLMSFFLVPLSSIRMPRSALQ
jgi:hypothetical protein